MAATVKAGAVCVRVRVAPLCNVAFDGRNEQEFEESYVAMETTARTRCRDGAREMYCLQRWTNILC